jgi:hypothetical protein
LGGAADVRYFSVAAVNSDNDDEEDGRMYPLPSSIKDAVNRPYAFWYPAVNGRVGVTSKMAPLV